jgi:hypothetical protein
MTRKVILYIAMSSDGYIAKDNDNIDFLSIIKDEKDIDFVISTLNRYTLNR